MVRFMEVNQNINYILYLIVKNAQRNTFNCLIFLDFLNQNFPTFVT